MQQDHSASKILGLCRHWPPNPPLFAVMALPDRVVPPVNVGNPGEFTVLELAAKVLDRIDGPSRLRFCDLPADDPRQRRPDIDLIRRLTGWQPKVQLDEGLDRTIAYFADALDRVELAR